MNYLLKLPFKYTLSLDDKMAREEVFAEEFQSIVALYHNQQEAIEQAPVYSITHDLNDNYVRLYVDAPKLPKAMDEAIEHAFYNIFSGKMDRTHQVH